MNEMRVQRYVGLSMIGLLVIVLILAIRANGPEVSAYGENDSYTINQRPGEIRVSSGSDSGTSFSVSGWVGGYGNPADVFLYVDGIHPVRAATVAGDRLHRLTRFSGQYPIDGLPPGPHRLAARTLFFGTSNVSSVQLIGVNEHSRMIAVPFSKSAGVVKCRNLPISNRRVLSGLVVYAPGVSSRAASVSVESGAGISVVGHLIGFGSKSIALLAGIDGQGWIASVLGSNFTVRIPTAGLGLGVHTLNFCAVDPGSGAVALGRSSIKLIVQPAGEQLSIDTVNGSVVVQEVKAGAAFSIPYDKPVTITGWVVDPVTRQPASTVQIAIDGKIVGRAVYGKQRSDVAAAFHEPDYTSSGFEAVVPAGSVDRGDHILRLAITSSGGVRSLSKASLNVTVR
jgi:hypothetical protein